ncbi:response regulator, partial [Escherichia coli]|nr:response regulator [Escherichia coli]
AVNGKEALEQTASHSPDVVLLDLGLPDVEGLDVLRDIRVWSKVPIIVVSARDHEREKVTALDLGADDYITKPFGTSELLA